MGLEINTKDVALIFEGGGMRNAYTAAVLTTLLEENINFPKVYGVSAGAELAVDYVARDALRAKTLFTEVPDLPETGGVFTFLTGRGFFNTTFLFQELARIASQEHQKDPFGAATRCFANVPHAPHASRATEVSDLWFDSETFAANPADVHIEALDLSSGETQAWTKCAMPTTEDVMIRVAASCSYPIFTPQITIDGRSYIDGGMGTSHGICLASARADGFDRFFVVRTRPRDFRLKPLSFGKRVSYRIAYATHQKAYRELLARPELYNAQLDELDRLEREGAALQFCPKTMPISYMTSNTRRLLSAYELGLSQAKAELPLWRAWLDL